MTRRLAQQIVITAFALALVIPPLGSVAPPATLALQSSNSYHWERKSSQFTLEVGNNVDGNWNSVLDAVISDWNNGDTVTFRKVSGATSAQSCSPKTGTVQVCNGQYGTAGVGWLGLTRLYFNSRGDHVNAATVQMNDSYLFGNSDYNNQNARRHTMCHELGHTPGLDHVNTSSCMNNSNNAIFNNLFPISDDFQKLAQIYKHSDSSDSVAKSKKKKKGKGKGKKNGKSRKNKTGKPAGSASTQNFFDPAVVPDAATSLDGSETVSVERLEDGTKVVTFVTWAE
ncbi:MAG: hypothetical protein H0T18_06705 [Chloroflexia bacterium]|nr:hypothetical protein [Chloroflexia bacterium]